MSTLSGYKTYIAAAGLILTALAAFIAGEVTLVEFITTMLEGLGIAALRAGVKKS